MRRAALIVITLLIAAAVDFGFFLSHVARQSADPQLKADGIAVLTGARERITAAAQLLAEGKGARLLISGVHERTPLTDLLRIDPALEPFTACCIDLGRKATNTIGNAQEVTAWARARTYHSLWLVTSDYHMPRAQLELQQAAPDLVIYPWPVSSAQDGGPTFWRNANVWRLILSEWVKFHVVRLRIALGLPMNETE
jgi:uncharacterized SAM-binding protein YcdF (DUF218 family)